MEQINFIQVTPSELVQLITESVKEQIKELVNGSNKGQGQDEPEFLTRKETALYFRVSYVSIHSWTNNGILKVYKIGNKSFYKRSELVSVLESSNRS